MTIGSFLLTLGWPCASRVFKLIVSFSTVQYLWYHLQNCWGLWDYCLDLPPLYYFLWFQRDCCWDILHSIANPVAPLTYLSHVHKLDLLWNSKLNGPFISKFNPQLLSDFMIRFFLSWFQDSKTHSTTKCCVAGFIFSASMYWYTLEANCSS